MIIKVKKNHIRKGRQNDPQQCPIAHALRASLGVSKIAVNKGDVVIGRKKFNLPPEAETFVHDFDTYGKSSVQPFAFEL